MRNLGPGVHVAFGAAVLVMGLLFTDWCAVVFECGCRSLWNGAAELCNIHASSRPHCPWCEHPLLGGGTAFLAALGGQWLALYRLQARLGLRFAAAILVFPLSSGAVAWIQRVVWSYSP